MYSSLCLLKILSHPHWIEQRMGGVRCGVFCTSSRSPVCVLVWVLHFAPWIYTKGLSIFTVRLIVVISLCSILLHNLITNRESLLLNYKSYYSKYSVN
jgi:hypothetical protein